ncbi:MAG: rhomboid family intramembrane serine protease [Leptospiraceae bacterium]|nr:rhomboid family intramembrane serine protease [Leptospiraceae bacterium]
MPKESLSVPNPVMHQSNAGYSFYLPPITDNVLRLTLILFTAWLAQAIATTFFYEGSRESLFWQHALFYQGQGFQNGFHPAQVLTHLMLFAGSMGGFWDLFFDCLLLYFFGSELERQWGGHHFLRFTGYAMIGGAIAAILMRLVPGMVQAGFWGLTAPLTAILVAYAMLWPNRQVLLFFVIPIRIKVLLLGGTFLYGVIAIVSGQYERLISMSSGALSGALFLYYYAHKGLRGTSADQNWSTRSSSAGSVDRYGHPGGTGGAGLKTRIAQYRKQKRLQAKQDQINRRIEMKEEVDRLLARISRDGMDSLSSKEKKFLDKASHLF